MNIHEYQAKELLARFGVPVPAGHAAMSVEEAVAAAAQLPGPLYVVKAQIHAGGRGKGKFRELGPDAKGGVRLARTLDEVRAAAAEMLGNTLVTVQTGAAGKQVNRLYVTDGVEIEKEFYLALLVDRKTGRIAFVASTEGGMNIEDGRPRHAGEDPDASPSIRRPASCRITAAPSPHASASRASSPSRRRRSPKLLYEAFLGTDASQIEINPLAVTDKASCWCSTPRSASIPTPSSATPISRRCATRREEDPMELEASKYDLAYIKLDGNIGCMVNGAGLAMATMDIIKLNGAFPANFCDVGGGASKEKVTAAFKIILSDPAVEGILVNIFGGIMRCDIIAEGIVAAAREIDIKVPLVVRLEGTNVEEGKAILADSGLAIVPADDLGDAARKIVAEVKASVPA